MFSMAAGSRPEGNGVEGVVRLWWRSARGSERNSEHRRCSLWHWRGGPVVGGAGRQWCTHGHGGNFGYSPRCHCFVDVSEPAVLEDRMAPAAQPDRAIEARRQGSSTVAMRRRGACSAWLEEQSDGIGSLWSVAWWPAARQRGTARGGEAGDAWTAGSVAGTVVLDIAHEQQRSSGARWKSRVASG
jgi:hypothetical protein